MNNDFHTDKLLERLGLSLMATGALLLIGFCTWNILPERPKEADAAEVAVVTMPQKNTRAWADLSVAAKSVLVYDTRDREILFAKNEEQQLPLASITKVMTAITAKALSTSEHPIIVSRQALTEEGDYGLRTDERWKLNDLLKFSLVVSSNDGMRAIASVIGSQAGTGEPEARKRFVDAMNAFAQSLGLSQTYFLNESGLDLSDNLGGGYGSARDVAHLFEYAIRLYPDIFGATKQKEVTVVSDSNIKHLGRNTNTGIDLIPHIIASKTGTSALAGGNVVVAFEPELERKVIIVVLGSTATGRFEDAALLAKRTVQYFEDNNVGP